MSDDALLTVEDLHTVFYTRQGALRALNGVSFQVWEREILGLVGETGSGKSLTAASILKLVLPPGRVVRGRALFQGIDLLALPEEQLRARRGRDISLVTQNAKAALNPLLPVGKQILNIYSAHLHKPRRECETHMLEMLRDVGFTEPEVTARRYPHELSGGMAQRAVIAMALGTSPQLVVADEPTTGLDATVQVQVLDLLVASVIEAGASALLITHDLGIVANYCDRVAMMHAGRIVEAANVDDFFAHPRHPYSVGLLNAQRRSRLGDIVIQGSPPDLAAPPSGCAYRERCPLATEICASERPEPREIEPEHWTECHHAEQLQERERAPSR